MTKIKPASTNIDRDPFPQFLFEHELMDPPPMSRVITSIIGVVIICVILIVLIVLIVLATRYFGWIP